MQAVSVSEFNVVFHTTELKLVVGDAAQRANQLCCSVHVLTGSMLMKEENLSVCWFFFPKSSHILW